jgi:hypothetical protein
MSSPVGRGCGVRQEIDERVGHALAHPGSTDLVAVARLREQVEALDAQYDRAPSASLLAETGQCLGQVSFLRMYAPGPRIRRELAAVEAESATLMGQFVWDASQRRDHHAAYGYFDQAITAAANSGTRFWRGVRCSERASSRCTARRTRVRGWHCTQQRSPQEAAGPRRPSGTPRGRGIRHARSAGRLRTPLGEADRHFDRIGQTDGALELFSPT